MTWQNRIVGAGTEDPEKLIPHPKNWRKHPKGQAQALEGAIEEIGWIQDIIINQRTGRMIDGHLRAELAIKNKEKVVPVKYVDLSEEEEEKALLTLDPISMMAEADKDRLSALLQNITSDNEKVNQLLEDIGREYKVSTNKAEEDDYEPPAEIETDIVRGDIFQLGRHRVMCGDSTCREDVERLMDGGKADLLITDPPFFTPASHYQSRKKYQRKFSDLSTLTGFINQIMDSFTPFLKKEGHLLLFCNCDSYAVFYPVLFSYFEKTKSLVWDKCHVGLGRIFRHQHELIIWGRNKDHYFSPDGELYSDVLPFEATPSKDRVHPVEKPISLLSHLIIPLSPKNGIVCDLFCGGGGIISACEQCERTAHLMELDPKYTEITIQRWEKLTGNKREKVNGVNT